MLGAKLSTFLVAYILSRAEKLFKNFFSKNTINALARRRDLVVISSAPRIEDPGFESRRGVWYGFYVYIAVLLSKLKVRAHCVYLTKMNAKKLLKSIFAFLPKICYPFTNIISAIGYFTKKCH
jgi:hypothetical protein